MSGLAPRRLGALSLFIAATFVAGVSALSASAASAHSTTGGLRSAGATGASVAAVGMPAAVDEATWRKETAPLPKSPNGAFKAISCFSTASCTAVGSFSTDAGNEAPFAEQWNGTSWTVQHVVTPTGIKSGALSAVSCSAPKACTAVGNVTNAAGQELPLAEGWDGADWSVEPTPSPAGSLSSSLAGVSCSTSAACTAVGSATSGDGIVGTLAEAWNGDSWMLENSIQPTSAISAQLQAVSCPTAASCSAVGRFATTKSNSPLAETWNGSIWTIHRVPTPSERSYSALAGISCVASNSCIAVGSYQTKPGAVLMLADRWNGSTWTAQQTAFPTGSAFIDVVSVACSTVTSCTAVGPSGNASDTSVTFAERLTGSTWEVQQPANPAAAGPGFVGVACPTGSLCEAVGGETGPAGGAATLAERWSNASWTLQHTPNGYGAQTSTLAAVSCAAVNACTTVGTRDGLPLAEAWNGAAWHAKSTPRLTGMSSAVLNAVSCPSGNACTAVGDEVSTAGPQEPLAEVWNGVSWAVQTIADPSGAHVYPSLAGVSCPTTVFCAAVGTVNNPAGGSTALGEVWNGTSWALTIVPSPPGATDAYLTAVSCTSATTCLAVGSYFAASGVSTFAAFWNGAGWTDEQTVNPGGANGQPALTGISCVSQTACTAVGNYIHAHSGVEVTLAEIWNGTTWAVEKTANPTTNLGSSFAGVSCTSSSSCTAVGQTENASGLAVTLAENWNGVTWTIHATTNPPGDGTGLAAVSCQPGPDCTAAGSAGTDAFHTPYVEAELTPGPSVPGSLTLTPCAFVCSAPVLTSGNGSAADPLDLSALSYDPEPGNLTYEFRVFAGSSQSTLTAPIVTETILEAPGTAADPEINDQTLPDGQYSFDVDASGAGGTSAYSALMDFTIDTTRPAVPILDSSVTSPSFQIGHPGTIQLDAGSSNTHAYVYGWLGGSLALPDDSTCSADPQQSAAYIAEGTFLTCPTDPATTGPITPIAPPDTGSAVLYYEAISASGEVSGPGQTLLETGTDPNAFVDQLPTHDWHTDHCSATGTEQADSGNATAKDPLTDTSPLCAAIAPGSAGSAYPVGPKALSFAAGTHTVATGSSPATNLANGFSVGAWIDPMASGADQVVLSQDPTSTGITSDFSLSYSASGEWKFTVPTSPSTSASVADTVAAPLNTWAFVVGVWDPGNDQIRLFVNGDLMGSAYMTSTDWQQGPVVMGRGYLTGPAGYFTGQVANAFVDDGTDTAEELSAFEGMASE